MDLTHENSFYCLVVGSRNFLNYELMKKTLDKLLVNYNKDVVIVSGGAIGADSLAEKYAKEKGYIIHIIRPNWNLGKKAGYLRNKEMHEFISNHAKRGVVAFWDGKSAGTKQNFELAKNYNNPIRIIRF